MASKFTDLFYRAHTAERLPAGLRGGAHANLLRTNSVTFVLHAPHKLFVSLVGDFNQWDTRANPLQTDGSGTWWTTIRHPGHLSCRSYIIVGEKAHAWVGDP